MPWASRFNAERAMTTTGYTHRGSTSVESSTRARSNGYGDAISAGVLRGVRGPVGVEHQRARDTDGGGRRAAVRKDTRSVTLALTDRGTCRPARAEPRRRGLSEVAGKTI